MFGKNKENCDVIEMKLTGILGSEHCVCGWKEEGRRKKGEGERERIRSSISTSLAAGCKIKLLSFGLCSTEPQRSDRKYVLSRL